jgi:hypothetical protein
LRIRKRAAWAAPRAPKRVTAYHGCSSAVAERILAGEQFRVSTNDYDWLGSGIYFWEYAPFRAAEWARKRYGDDGAVIEARVELGHCLNLLDSEYFADLRAAYHQASAGSLGNDSVLPANVGGRHMLDRLVVDRLCLRYMTAAGKDIQVVRGCFPEGEPVFDGSRILRYTHVQIAVRDESCISGLRLVQSN